VGLYVCMEVGDVPRVIAMKEYGSYKSCAHVPVSPSRHRSIEHSAWGRWQFRSELFLRETSSIYNILIPPAACKEFAISLKGKMETEEVDNYESMLLANIEAIHKASGIDAGHIVFWLIPSNHESAYLLKKSSWSDEDARFYQKSRVFWDGMVQS